jgi:hypothetical protein
VASNDAESLEVHVKPSATLHAAGTLWKSTTTKHGLWSTTKCPASKVKQKFDPISNTAPLPRAGYLNHVLSSQTVSVTDSA